MAFAATLLGLSLATSGRAGLIPAFVSPVAPFGLTDVGYRSTPSFVDIDGDGDFDALIGEEYGNILFFENTGSATFPTFAPPVTNPFGLADVGNVAKPSFADADDDGDLDAFIGEYYAGVVFFENIGSASLPSFALPQTNPFGLQADVDYSHAPGLADIDDDGDLDLFIGAENGGIYLFENTGTRTAPAFGEPVVEPFGYVSLGYDATPQFLDIDGDGDLDLLLGEELAYDAILFENTGTASAPAFGIWSVDPFGMDRINAGYHPVPRLVDIDGDGDLDALVGNEVGRIFFLEATGFSNLPNFADVPPNPFGIAASGYRGLPELADIDGDGDVDVFIGTYAGDTLFFENTGTATSPAFRERLRNPFGLVDVDGATPALGDIDDDGDLDALYGKLFGNLLFFENSGSPTVPAFAAPLTNPFGLFPVGFRVTPELADIDNDDDLDLFVGEDNGNTFYFKNQGTPSAPAFMGLGYNLFGLKDVGYSSAPELSDIDGDGDLDALLSRFPGDIVYFRNRGTASAPIFATPVTNPFGLANIGLHLTYLPAFGDIDGDGDVDLLIGDYTGDFLFVENAGTPRAPAFVPVLTNPFGIAAVGPGSTPVLADLDGDGDLDALVGDGFGVATFFRNTGTTTSPAFAAGSVNALGLADVGIGSHPALADLDGDGDLDALIGELSGDLFFFENTGSAGAPGFATAVTNPFGLTPWASLSAPTLGDLDADGDLDALVGSGWDGETVAFYENIGGSAAPAFALPIPYPFGLGYLSGQSTPALADIDGDDDLDVLIGSSEGPVFMFENVGTTSAPAFAPASRNPLSHVLEAEGTSPALGDIDGDGDLDALVGDYLGKTIFFENTGPAGTPILVAPLANPFGFARPEANSRPAFADVDGDGDLDGFLGSFYFLENIGTAGDPAFAPPVENPFGLGDAGSPGGSAFVDIDGDGDLDVLTGSNDGGTLFFRNTGTASAPAFSASSSAALGLTDVGEASVVAMVDIDADADFDAFIRERFGNISFFRNTGTALVPAFAPPVLNPFGIVDLNGFTLAFADLEDDGDLDLFVTQFDGEVVWFENTGTGGSPAFAAPMTNPMGFESVGEETALAFADIDGDGDLDALIGQSEGNTFLFENVSLGCPRTPARGCVEFGKGSLFVLEAIPGREKLIAKLEKGPTLGQADFGSPLDVWGSFYDLCLYDDQGGLAGQLDLDRPGDLCGAAPCWKELGNNRLGTGYLYKDTAAAADGFVLAKLKAGGAGKSSVLLKAQNDVAHGELAMPGGIAPALSVTTSVDVQMRTSDSGCYSATLSDVSRQDNRLFKAK